MSIETRKMAPSTEFGSMQTDAPRPDRHSIAGSAPIRDGGIDALRAVMTLLVLFHHSAITYGASGGWFYRELSPDGSRSSNLLILFVSVNQAYFMGLFFLLAGYFTPAAFRAKGPWRYVRDRLARLGAPLLAFGLLLGPVTVALAGISRGYSFTESLLDCWRQGRFIEGPLWFAEALLIFGVAAMPWLLRQQRKQDGAQDAAFPSNTVLAVAALTTGAAAFVIRLWWPVSANWHGLQFGYFASYATLFIGGCAAAGPRWLERIPRTTARVWFGIALATLPVMPAAWLLRSTIPALHATSDGGWTLPAVLYAFWEPMVAWGLILVLLVAFQRRFRQLSPLWRKLSARAYTIYIIHPPVLVGLALAWRTIAAPALLKFAITGVATCAISFLLAGLILRCPGARRLL